MLSSPYEGNLAVFSVRERGGHVQSHAVGWVFFFAKNPSGDVTSGEPKRPVRWWRLRLIVHGFLTALTGIEPRKHLVETSLCQSENSVYCSECSVLSEGVVVLFSLLVIEFHCKRDWFSIIFRSRCA